jgi:hypothetical protein
LKRAGGLNRRGKAKPSDLLPPQPDHHIDA